MSDVGDFYYIRRYRDEPGDPLEQREAQKKRELRDREIEEYLNTKIRPRLVSVVTSSTRPTSNLYRGMKIYETDTGNELTYYGATTGWLKPWNTGWGLIGNVLQTSAQTGITTETDLTGMTVTWTTLANRIYEIKFSVPSSQATAGGAQAIYVADGSNVHYFGTNMSVAAGSSYHHSGVGTLSGFAAGSVTLKLRATASAGSMSTVVASGFPATFSVTDIGASGSAPAA